MTQTAAVGDGPITYFTDDGQQVSLPLSAIYFDGNTVKSKPPATTALDKWLRYLVAEGRLAPGPTPAPADAMIFKAAAPGSAGNDISVKVAANVADATKVDITVIQTDVYTGLTVATISGVLGTSAQPGTASRPGLVRVQSIAAGSPDPAPGPASPAPAGAGNPAWIVASAADATAPAFTLEARGAGSDKGVMAITVSNLTGTAVPKTFTLTVLWTATITVGPADLAVSPTDPTSKFAALAFAVAVAPPASSANLLLPATGTFSLSGGAEPAASTLAAATLPASS